MSNNLQFTFTTKRVVIEGEHYIETTEGYEGQPAKWMRYGPIPENMVDEVAESLHDGAERMMAGVMFSVERGILLPAPEPLKIEGKPMFGPAHGLSVEQHMRFGHGHGIILCPCCGSDSVECVDIAFEAATGREIVVGDTFQCNRCEGYFAPGEGCEQPDSENFTP